MKNQKLSLYTVDVNYGAELAKADNRVMSISPLQQKENRPFVGIIIILDNKEYCIPLTSPKPKHEKMKNNKDFIKLSDKEGKPLGALNLNNMIPVEKSLIKIINIIPQTADSPQNIAYKKLLQKQLMWCNSNKENITKRAEKLYKIIVETPEKIPQLTKRCCDFKKLETTLDKYLIDNGLKNSEKEYIIKEISEEQFNALKSSKIPFKTAVKDGQRAIKFEAELNEKINSILNANMNKNVL